MSEELLIHVAELKPHPKNSYYFDDIENDNWDDFLRSVRTSGVTNAITIDQDNRIISGHQRVRACKVLGISEIKYSRITYSPEDLNTEYPLDVKDLIESNLKQRVAANPNPLKLGRCIVFLEGYYGIQHGGDRNSSGKYFRLVSDSEDEQPQPKTQKDLADIVGMDVRTLRNYKLLAQMIPEIQDLVDTGIVSPTTARAIVKELTEDQQRQLAEEFVSKEEKVTATVVNSYIKKIRDLTEENDKLKSAPPKTVTVEKIVEVPPADYDSLKKQVDELTEQNTKLATDLNSPAVSSDLLNRAIIRAETSEYELEEIRKTHERIIAEKQKEVDVLTTELDELRRVAKPVVAEMTDDNEVYEFCNMATNFVNEIYKFMYSNAFRKIHADHSLPLNTVAETCGKILEATQDLIKRISTEEVVVDIEY